MSYKQIIVKLVICCLVFVSTNPARAQQNKVDSILLLLSKTKTEKGIDTVTFRSALNLIRSTYLSDSGIMQIENAGKSFNKGEDEDMLYMIKLSIWTSLYSDISRAIDYGKQNIEKLESNNSPKARVYKNIFLTSLRIPYRNSDRLAEGLQYYTERINKYQANNDSLGLADCYFVLSGFYRAIGLADQAVYSIKKSISYLDSGSRSADFFFGSKTQSQYGFWKNHIGVLGQIHLENGDLEQSVKFSTLSLEQAPDDSTEGRTNAGPLRNLAHAKILLGQLDSVEHFLNRSDSLSTDQPNLNNQVANLQIRSLYKIQTGALQEADSLLQRCWQLIKKQNIDVNTPTGIIAPDYYLALVRVKQNRYREAIDLLNRDVIRVKNFRSDVLRDYKLLAELYEKTGDNKKAVEVLKSFISLQDSMLADQNKFRTISFETEQQISENELSITKLESKNKLSILYRNFSIGIAALLLIIAAGVYNRFRSKQKANRVLEKTLAELKATQTQLIQSEKMASLGELTAGIAHEIQNPLNFVNNFSEVNKEMLAEMREEIEKKNFEEVSSIAKNIEDNENKIIFHGKRADTIVKSMLQHSHSSSSVKELTDINALADEYLRLAYHGLRARDKSFNAAMKTAFDESLEKVNVVPQDMGRVILNLINNAFYAVSQKQSELNRLAEPVNAEHSRSIEASQKYEPTVTVSTKKNNGMVEISVKDNGPGIPEHVVNKIFQPFFTTKPTGQGTGLGLSLAYDIVKAHGGELKVDTKEGAGSEFTIKLPIV